MSILVQYYNKEEQIETAILIVRKILENLNNDGHYPLKRLLDKYHSELFSTNINPIILNQIAIDISGCMLNNRITLTKKETEHFEQLFTLIARGEL